MRKISFVILLLSLSVGLWAVPATPEAIVRVLPDGSTDTVYLHGDEYHHFMTDCHGRRIAESEYTDEVLRRNATSRQRAPQQQMLYSFVPSQGKVRVPVILLNFSDLSFTLTDPQAQFDDLYNGAGGSNPHATGSVHDYYTASSDSALDLEYEVFGPYTLSKEMAYYGQNKTSGGYTDHMVNMRELVLEAMTLAQQAGVDFSQYDANNDGYIDNVSLVVAGYNEAEGGSPSTIWPHYSTINNSTRYSGKRISGYLVISEYRGSGGKVQAGIGTYCHEFGHALGLPDLYNTQTGEATSVDQWDIMCSGSYNNEGSTPPTYTAFERFMMGWLVPEQLSTAGMRTLEPIETSNRAFLIAARKHNLKQTTPSPSEYFLIENRQAVGWDAGPKALVASGLLISHITFNNDAWNYNTFNNQNPLGYTIVSAGTDAPTRSSEMDVFPGSTMRTTWTPTLNNGNTIDTLSLTQIRQRSDLSISMQVGASTESMSTFDTEELIVETSFLTTPVAYDTARTILHVPAMTADSIRVYVSSPLFRFSTDGGAQWLSNKDTAWLRITPNQANNYPIDVLFDPSRQNCNYTYAFLTVETADERTGNQLTLAGRSPRPTYITTPVMTTVTNLTSTSFHLSWEPQEDAEWFYYLLYTVSEGESEEIEEFEHFATLNEIHENGWDANFARSQSVISESGNAVLFERSGNYIQSPQYLYAPTAISMWLSNNYTPNSADSETGGLLQLTASSDGVHWETAATISVQRTTKNVFRTFELDTLHHWRQFRLSYTHIGGSGGAAVDTWTVSLSKNVHYLYRLKDYYIDGTGHEIVLRQLEPNTTYYYAMQAYEGKGCDPHYTPLCEPFVVRTRGAQENANLEISRTGKGRFDITLPEMADGKHYLNIYSQNGELFSQMRPSYGTYMVSLPYLPIGQLYMVKYYTTSIHRKDPKAKILSY